MKQLANIHCRIDSNLKDNVDIILQNLGLNISEAIRIFFAQIILSNGIPFDIKIPNKTTIAAIEESKDKTKLHKANSIEDLLEKLSE